jgi:hypothetical protein
MHPLSLRLLGPGLEEAFHQDASISRTYVLFDVMSLAQVCGLLSWNSKKAAGNTNGLAACCPGCPHTRRHAACSLHSRVWTGAHHQLACGSHLQNNNIIGACMCVSCGGTLIV